MNQHIKPVGIFHRGDGKCECRVWAPLKERIELILHASSCTSIIALTKDELGYWSAGIENTCPGTRYEFRINGEITCADPASLIQPDGINGPSEIADRYFNWTDNTWKGIAPGEMIIYELHTGTFTQQGDFDGVITKLDYLQELGVNTIELMPVAQFPGKKSWGYDLAFPFAVQQSYGGIQGLKRLVNAAHEKGMAVILDVVYNHIGPEGAVLHHFAPYFTDKYKTPWGAAINLDDTFNYGVRNYYLQNVLMWLGEFHIDGLRLDAVHALFDTSALNFVEEMQRMVNTFNNDFDKKKILIAEFDLNNPRYINPVEHGGYGLAAQWVDEFHHALHSAVTGERNGYYEDFGELDHLYKAFHDTYVYTGQYSVQRKKFFGIPVYNPYNQFIVFAQNHDHIGNRMLGERLTAQLSFEQLKLVASTVLLSPYIPLLYMGEEYGEKNPFLFFADYADKELVKNVREGRKKEFGHFGWEGEPPDPFAEHTFDHSKLSWKNDSKESAALFEYYRHLLSLRKQHPAWKQFGRHSMIVHPLNDKKIISFERIAPNEHLLVILNFSRQPSSFTASPHCWNKMFDSSDNKWLGTGEPAPDIIQPGVEITVPAFTALLYKESNE